MDINFIGCADAGGASTAIDALRSSAYPRPLHIFQQQYENNIAQDIIATRNRLVHGHLAIDNKTSN